MEEKRPSTRVEKVRKLGKQIEGYVQELAEEMRGGKSEKLVRYLEFAASFHSYSFGNLMLIFEQCPHATKVAGLRHWNRLGRRVRPGEHGIVILAPMAVWNRTEKHGEEGAASEEETSASERGERRDKITLFKPVYVFDISATEGDPLPEVEWASGDAVHYLPALVAAVGKMGIELQERKIVERSGATKGASYDGKIILKAGLPEAEAFAVLAHEVSHELLHWEKGVRLSVKIQEVEAEATAFVVCRHFGIECKSSDYLLLHNAKPEQILERLERVRETASKIIGAIESEMRAEMLAESV